MKVFCVVFPIYMYSYVGCIRCNNIIDFCETISVNLIILFVNNKIFTIKIIN